MKKKGTNLADGIEIDESTQTVESVDNVQNTDDELLNFVTPEITETADDFIEPDPEQENARASEPSLEDYRGQLDDKGQAFDPLLHDYPARKTPTGKWAKRPKNKPAPEIPEGQDELLANAKYRAEAEKMGLLYGNLHRLPFGENGKLDMQAIAPLIDDIERYMMENGHTQISPKWAMLLSGSMYSLAVCQRPSNKEKVLKWLSPVTGFFNKLIGRKPKQDKKEKSVNDANITGGGTVESIKRDTTPKGPDGKVEY